MAKYAQSPLSLAGGCLALLAVLSGGCATSRAKVELPPEQPPRFEAVNAGADLAKAAKTVSLRGSQTLLLYARQGDTVAVSIVPRHLGKPVRYQFVSPDGVLVAEGELTDSQANELRLPAVAEGTYRLALSTDHSVSRITVDARPAVIQSPVHLFNCATTLYFHVPEDTRNFDVFVRGDGALEQAAVDLRNADGEPVVTAETGEVEGEKSLAKIPVTVPAAQAGRTWSVCVRKSGARAFEDAYLSFSPDIPPYVALAAETLLRERQTTPEEMRAMYGPFVDELRQRLTAASAGTANASYWRSRLSAKLDRLAENVAATRTFEGQKRIRASLLEMDALAAALTNGSLGFEKCMVRTVKAISNRRVYPDTAVTDGVFGGPLLLVATPGEYESGSFVVTAEESLSQLAIGTADLVTPDGKVLPAAAVDIKTVKVWYQDAGRGYLEETPAQGYNPIGYAGKKTLIPELLLHDDAMIRVATTEAKNYIKVGGPDATTYVCVSDPDGVPGKTKADFAVCDAPALRPLDVPAGANQQFWVTLHIPDDAAAGVYEGALRLSCAAGPLGSLPVKVRALPFKFAPSRYMAGIYYYPPDKGYYGDGVMEQFRKEMADLHAHASDDTMMPFDIVSHPEAFEIRKSVGITSKTMFYRGWLPANEKTPAAVREGTARHVNALRQYGIENIYFYGIDEATGDRLASQRESWGAVHEAGGKIFVAGYTGKEGNFALMGDLQDLLVCAGYPLREEARNWHSKNHKIICYANPQGGLEAPDTYRRNFGFLLWQNEYDGLMTYIYHWGAAQNWGDKPGTPRHLPCVWNDFCRKDGYKQHNMVYPTADGVVDTLQWEGYREAVDDLRYISTLCDLIEAKAASASPAVRTAVKKAEAYLAELKERDVNVHKLDMDVLRADVIDHILAIRNAEGSAP